MPKFNLIIYFVEDTPLLESMIIIRKETIHCSEKSRIPTVFKIYQQGKFPLE
jgi:hypothetical protein